MDHHADITLKQTVGTPFSQHVKEETHTKVKDNVTGAERKVDCTRKGDGCGGKTDYHLKEDDGHGHGGRKVDYTRKDDAGDGTHKIDYKVREGEEEGILDKAARKVGLKK